MPEAIAAVLIAIVPLCIVAVVAMYLFHLSRSTQSVVETNAMLQHNNRRLVDALVTPPSDQLGRLEAEVDRQQSRAVRSDWSPSAGQDRNLYYPDGVDVVDEPTGGGV